MLKFILPFGKGGKEKGAGKKGKELFLKLLKHRKRRGQRKSIYSECSIAPLTGGGGGGKKRRKEVVENCREKKG